MIPLTEPEAVSFPYHGRTGSDGRSSACRISAYHISSALGAVLLAVALLFAFCSSVQADLIPVFEAEDLDGSSVNLTQFRGQPFILHIASVENPICRECEGPLKDQLAELEALKAAHPEVNVVTLNVRKNPYSEDGRVLAQSWWKVNVTWPWVEDFEPYPLANKFVDYTTMDGGFSNPTLVLVDANGSLTGVYHVYQLGKGEIDGVQGAKALYARLQGGVGDGSGDFGKIAHQEVTYLGMFALGIVTSLSPCSVALMIAVFSYILTSRRKELGLDDDPRIANTTEGLMIGLAFTLGMGLVFFFMGLFISQVGVFVREARSFDLIAGIIMVVLGINNFKPLGEIIEPITRRLGSGGTRARRKSPMERVVNISMDLFRYSAFIGAFCLGIFFALGWAPCAVSLVFPVLIWLASQDVTPLAGGGMLFVFGLGHGVPIIPISTFSRSVAGKIGDRYISVGRYVTGVFSASVILVGLVFAARYFGFVLW